MLKSNYLWRNNMKNYRKKILKAALWLIGLAIYIIFLGLVDNENKLYTICACFGVLIFSYAICFK